MDTWFIKDLYLDFLDVLSNGDLIAHIGISDGNIGSSEFALTSNYFLTRIDHETDKIIWAFSYFLNEVGNQVSPYNLKINNDTIWIIGHILNFDTSTNDTIYYIILQNNKKLYKYFKYEFI